MARATNTDRILATVKAIHTHRSIATGRAIHTLRMIATVSRKTVLARRILDDMGSNHKFRVRSLMGKVCANVLTFRADADEGRC